MRVRSSGATLALVIACTLVVIALGAFAFYLFQMLGGGRQTESAADAGSLNVAKIAVVAPSVTLDPNNPTSGAIDSAIKNFVLNGSDQVNLLSFNKVVAWGMIVAANATADGNTPALTLAKQVWMRIEGDPRNSIGAQLASALSPQAQGASPVKIQGNGADVPSGAWPTAVFNSAALSNATRSANSDEGQQITWQSFEVGYLGQGDSSNVPASLIQKMLPFFPANQSANRIQVTLPTNANGFIQGYMPAYVKGFFGTQCPFFFVTVYPDQNPGLRSMDEFNRSKVAPGAGTVTVPPNSFLNRATIVMKKSNSSLAVGSPSTVGTSQYPALDLQSGYLVFDNLPDGKYTGPLPGACNNVWCAELGPPGISVLKDADGPKLYSTNQGSLIPIMGWVDGGGGGGGGGDGGSFTGSLQGIYRYSDGGQATLRDVLSLKAPTQGLLVCTDNNSDTVNANSDAECSGKVNTFNQTYHPGGQKSTSTSISGLDAVAIAKNKVYAMWTGAWSGGSTTLNLSGSNSIDAGLGQYETNASPITNPSQEFPWGTLGVYNNGTYASTCDQFGQQYCCSGTSYINKDRIGRITKMLDLPGIFNQVTGISQLSSSETTKYRWDVVSSSGTASNVHDSDLGPGHRPVDVAYSYFKQRCLQMGAQQQEIDNLWGTLKLDVGNYLFVSMNKQHRLTASKTPPSGVTSAVANAVRSGAGLALDGMINKFGRSYNLLWKVVNAGHDFNIHDRMFTQVCNGGAVVATDTISLQAGCGASFGGCLGRFSFHQHVDNGETAVAPIFVPSDLAGTVRTSQAPTLCEPD